MIINLKNNIYIYQPFGSQNFPDFLVFTKEWILPLEIKFKTKYDDINALPKWNSNIPKANSLYIFSQANEPITYFIGSDFLGINCRNELLKYFDELEETAKEKLERLKETLISSRDKNPFGIRPYIRKDYVYDSKFRIGTNEVINNIFKYSEINRWEENLLCFLRELNEK